MTSKDLAADPAERPEVVDPNNAPVIYVDWVVTGGVFEHVVNLTLGTADHALKQSNDDLARVIIAARLRCSDEFAFRLHRTLGDILGIARSPDAKQAGETPPSPPKNLIN